MLETTAAWIRQLPIAHRGLHDGVHPENSLGAFEAGMRAGYALELDLHRLADGTVVVFHDDTLSRMAGREGAVTAQTWPSLRGLRLGATQETIPRLADVLDLVGGRVPLLLELKRSEPAWLEAATWEHLRGYHGPFAVQSFNPMTLAWFRRHAPAVVRGQLSSDFRGVTLPLYQKALLRRLVLHPWARPHFVSYDLRCLPYWAPSLLRRAGAPLVAWTVSSHADLERARGTADNIIFEGLRPPLSGRGRGSS